MTTDVEVGQEVHFVGFSHTDLPAKKHFLATVKTLRKRHGTAYADLFVHIGTGLDAERFSKDNVKLALSREEGTWHPIGGYGCEE